MTHSMSNFIRHIDEYIFKNESIYRSILVTNNDKDSNILKFRLENKDYSIMMLNKIDATINYNKINNRIIIITHDKFKEFINHLETLEDGLISSTFNFIAFHYFIQDEIVEDMISYYISKTNNNINNTIIFDKIYTNFLYLNKLVT